jgi:hypothetical protein
MDESENTFPMDLTDPSSRPWTFSLLRGRPRSSRLNLESVQPRGWVRQGNRQ